MLGPFSHAWSRASGPVRRLSSTTAARLVITLGTSSAVAQPGPRSLVDVTQLEYQGDCVTRGPLLAELRRWLKQSGTLPSDLSVQVSGHDAPSFSARFQIARGGVVVASREFSGDRIQCHERVQVLSSALGLALENYLEANRARELASPQPPKPHPRHEPAPSFRAGSYAGGWVGVGLLPRATWAATLGAEAFKGAWGLRAGALLTPAQTFPLGVGSARVQLLGGDWAGCRQLGVLPLTLAACLESRAGLLRISGSDYDVSLTSRDLFWDGGLSSQLDVPLASRVSLYVGARLGLTLRATTLVVRAQDSQSLLVSRDWPTFSYGALVGIRFALLSPPKNASGAAID